MSELIHYIFVRRDLPLGTMCAMVGHAAAESASSYDQYSHKVGSLPYHLRAATMVILEAKDQKDLHNIYDELISIQISAVPFTDMEFMSIGVVPGDPQFLRPLMSKFQTIKSCLPDQTEVADPDQEC